MRSFHIPNISLSFKIKSMRKRILLSLLMATSVISGLRAQNNFWTDQPEAGIQTSSQRKIIPNRYRTVMLDTSSLKNLLQTVPKEFSQDARLRHVIVSIPMPYGGFQRFSIVETEVMEPGLQAMFPQIKVFGGQGIDDPTATIKIDWTPRGFHAQILSSANGSSYIDPYAAGTLLHYISYYKKDLAPKSFTEERDPLDKNIVGDAVRTEVFNGCIGDTLRRYRLTVACTGEYAVAVGATTVVQALAAIVTSVNRVNGVYETELAVRLVLVDSNYKVVFVDPATDPFTQNNNGTGLLTENRRVCDSAIGTANYDIGHVFSTGGGGVATLGGVCRANNKARGVTGLPNPTGDAYDIDYVAHEMGHQFGGNHPFNATTSNCGGGNRAAVAAVEPGSGSSIMGYAGICGAINDLQPHSDPYFHAISYNEITKYTIDGNGNSCPVKILTGNLPPVANAGLDYIIPKSTPFVLTGTGSDPNDDVLTYSWDEMDLGPAGDWNAPVGQAPLFRFFSPTASPVRYFPKLSDVINNTTTIGEILPNYGRTINLRLVARDNRAGGGGICWDQTLLTVNGNSGPFKVISPNTKDSFRVGTFMHVKWDVANTNVAPVSCDSVALELSLDGGLTFPITLLSKTLNDGDEDVIVPNNPTSTARVRIRALKNVFYDMSDSSFAIKPTTASEFVFNDPVTVVSCNGVSPSTQLLTASLNGFTSAISLTASGNPAGTGVTFSGNPITPGSNVLVTLTGTIPAGNYSITVTGAAGAVVKTKVILFAVGTPTVAPLLSSPANNATGQSFTPTLSWQPVTGATGYNLLVSGSNSFTDTVISVVNITGTSYTFTTSLVQNMPYYWRVSARNTCGAGLSSGGNNFRTGFVVCSDTLRSTNVPVTIPLAAVTITSTLNIPAGGVINDVDVVGLKGTHTYVSDLSFNLRSPASTSVLLFGGVCTSQHDFDINLDDEAASGAITCPPTGGQVRRPTEALSKFDNENSTGTWTLSVTDADPADGGALTGWGLRICTYTSSPILPVNWLSFTATKNADNASVGAKWQTTSEINSHHYEIERSIDGRSFMMIGSIAAGRNSNGVQTYLFNDMAPVIGTNYYRVKQVDNDGKFTYSGVATVVFNKAGILWSVYPNPAKDKTTLYAKSNLNAVQVRLTDVSGKLLYNGYIPSLRAGQSVNIPLNNFSKGMYLLKIYSEKETSTEKIIIQ